MKKGWIWEFFAGGAIYCLIELAWRGYTHWTMALTGGACFVLLCLIDSFLPQTPYVLRCALGAMVITTVELAVGVVVNLWWGLGVWDYSEQPGNLLGQVCLAFTGLWFLLCPPAFLLHRLLSRGRKWLIRRRGEYRRIEQAQTKKG